MILDGSVKLNRGITALVGCQRGDVSLGLSSITSTYGMLLSSYGLRVRVISDKCIQANDNLESLG